MAQFLVILSDMDGNADWLHPTEIEATDKQDAMNAIVSSCPPESIKQILTPQEYRNFMSNGNARRKIMLENASGIGSENYQSGKDFMNDMINLAGKIAEENEHHTESSNNQIAEPNTTIIDSVPIQEQKPQKKLKQQPSSVKYFTDNGVMFKIEDGVLYKKCWEIVELSEITDEETGKIIPPEYRIINSETGKPIKTEKYSVQHLVWKELNNA